MNHTIDDIKTLALFSNTLKKSFLLWIPAVLIANSYDVSSDESKSSLRAMTNENLYKINSIEAKHRTDSIKAFSSLFASYFGRVALMPSWTKVARLPFNFHFMKTNTQRRASFFRFIMSLSMGLIWASLFFWITDAHALSASYTIKLCERTAWWVNYVESRKKTCDIIWQKMSYDTLKTFELWNQ